MRMLLNIITYVGEILRESLPKHVKLHMMLFLNLKNFTILPICNSYLYMHKKENTVSCLWETIQTTSVNIIIFIDTFLLNLYYPNFKFYKKPKISFLSFFLFSFININQNCFKSAYNLYH